MSTPAVSDLENSTNEIPSLLVPMAIGKLILPTVSVAEMIPYQPPKARQDVVGEDIPDWYLGSLAWRGVMVPMISFEVLNGYPMAQVVPESQVIILNNTGINSQLPFICMPTMGIPRLSRVATNEISENLDLILKDYEQMHVFVAGEQAIIPDVSKMEQTCVNLFGFY